MSERGRLILASASPRRAQLLREAGIEFEVQPMDVDERVPWSGKPREAAMEIAMRKARAVTQTSAWVLAADTLVVYQDKLIGKPADEMDAHATLRMLSGAAHDVVTGVAVRSHDGTFLSDAVSTRVTFRALTDEEIDEYVRSGEPMDKAGGYGIQGKARAFVASVDGPIDNVVGLPMDLVRRLLAEAGWRPG